MASFRIRGRAHLQGNISIAGSKNAALPILAATLLTEEVCRIHNIPRIRDVENFLSILESLGVDIVWEGEHSVRIQAHTVDPKRLDRDLVERLRGSVLLLGPLLARCRVIERFPEPGGCIIGNRPLDTHFRALESLGATIDADVQASTYALSSKWLTGTKIILPEFSVTATENVLMAASLARGDTILSLAAEEPHVQQLAEFLTHMGAKIKGAGNHTIHITGAGKLHGAEISLIPDTVEIGTFAVAALATRGRLRLSPVVPDHLDSLIRTLQDIGAEVHLKDATLEVRAQTRAFNSFMLQTRPYPGFPTDLQAAFGLLATQVRGTSLIHDTMFESRFGYAHELVKMGARIFPCDPHRILVTGPTTLFGREIPSLDLRAGATLIIAGLIATGTTVIQHAEIVDRGYERIEERLRAVGADIKRVEQK